MNTNDQLKTLRHSTEHVLTQAMLSLYPKIVMAMGPATDDGFYFDFDPMGAKISEQDFPVIEAEMAKIIKADLPITKKEVSLKEASALFKSNPYKLDWLKQIAKEGKTATLYSTGKDFTDLCAGPHLSSTGKIAAFKLLSVAGAYWHGSEKNKMLTRIYGTAFASKKDLASYLKQLEEAEKRDHRKIGKQFDLFSQNDELGPGLILWHPKLSVVREEIELWWRKEHRKRGYQYIYTPHIGKKALWDRSGHTGFYKDLMYPPLTDQRGDVYFLKPMNCNGHMLIYKSRPRSYRELPIRWCELGTVYRYELEGVRHGILRPRGFTQDDAHIVCTKDQLVSEVENVLDFALEMNSVFGFNNLHYELSVRDPENQQKYAGSSADWDSAEKTLRAILKKRRVKFSEDPGGAKFYGPSIDLKAEDALGRLWQGTTIQFDFNLPSRFNLTYIGPDGSQQTPFMIHRTLLGSMERFVGVLIEQHAGAFPVWLAPLQAIIIPITNRHLKYAESVRKQLESAAIRVQLDDNNDTASAKIRQGEQEKIPYLLVVGDREQNNRSVSVRLRGGRDLGTLKLDKIIDRINNDIENKL